MSYHLDFYILYQYDTDGNTIHEEYWSKHDSEEEFNQIYYTDYSFDDRGNCISSITTNIDSDGNDEYETRYEYVYDAEGHILEKTSRDITSDGEPNGTVRKREIYDKNGALLKCKYYLNDGTLEKEEEYDHNGNQLKSLYYNEDGTVSSEYVYDYNEKEVLISITETHNHAETTETTVHTMIYDEYGNYYNPWSKDVIDKFGHVFLTTHHDYYAYTCYILE